MTGECARWCKQALTDRRCRDRWRHSSPTLHICRPQASHTHTCCALAIYTTHARTHTIRAWYRPHLACKHRLTFQLPFLTVYQSIGLHLSFGVSPRSCVSCVCQLGGLSEWLAAVRAELLSVTVLRFCRGLLPLCNRSELLLPPPARRPSILTKPASVRIILPVHTADQTCCLRIRVDANVGFQAVETSPFSFPRHLCCTCW